MLFRILIIMGCLYTPLAIANTLDVPNEVEIGNKDISTHGNTESTAEKVSANQESVSEVANQNIPINCNTLLTFEKRLAEAENAANSMSLLISSFEMQVQHLNAKVAEVETKEEFDGYMQIINAYNENLSVVKQQRAKLLNGIIVIREQIDFIKQSGLNCEFQD